ncbi:hypothetical protein [Streptomyces sp. 900105755]
MAQVVAEVAQSVKVFLGQGHAQGRRPCRGCPVCQGNPKGPTRACAAHKALLRAWAVGGISAADEAMFDIAMPLFETGDVKTGLASAVDAFKAGLPRPTDDFQGR